MNPDVLGGGRGCLDAFIEHSRMQGAITVLILVNAALLGLETWPAAMAAAGGLILALDQAILTVFVVEIAAPYTCIAGPSGAIPGACSILPSSPSP